MSKIKLHTLLGILSLAICMIFILAGLWPFNFFPQNRVEWNKQKEGMRFQKFGFVYQGNLFGEGTDLDKEAITIEVSLSCNTPPYDHLSDIISQYRPSTSEFYSISQWKEDLILRKLENKGINKEMSYQEISLDNVLSKGTKAFLTITSDRKSTRIYLNGRFTREFPEFTYLKNKKSGDLFLGNSPTGQNQWEGELFSLALYDHPLNEEAEKHNYRKWQNQSEPYYPEIEKPTSYFRFDGTKNSNLNQIEKRNALYIPKTYHVAKRTFFSSPPVDYQLTRNYFGDLFVNLVGFIPFGYFFIGYLYTSRKSHPINGIFLFTMICGFGISFAIEFTQAFLPDRNSSLTDLINNTIGTVIGAFLFRLSLTWLNSRNFLK